ncbi:MAG: PEP-CTERM sorting domain-containing protein [Rubrivivax sp.]|nr:PEP-CTERM sorting domain-containing protein [Rubrivivax sp.]
MKSQLKLAGLALALSCSALTAQAANVTLTTWAFGTGNSVAVVGTHPYSGKAGGFVGSLVGAGSFDNNPFITYCIELTESFNFGGSAMTGYAVVDGADYFLRRYNDASKSDQLGRLMTYAYGDAARVDTAAESTSLQLAIWNVIYDTDQNVTARGASFRDTSIYGGYADTLLAGGAATLTSRFNVYALERAGSQDFLLLSAISTPQSGNSSIPEPASLALAMLALGVAGAATRRKPISVAAA